ncbi:hypothetical protein AMATHDRAFT_45148 [Amanita thiersii Skay4041]|uniref:Uncharacterized protein n=1 Tax=Amanita thiersii Skay4041 TaxID=703135 RepID=A0A2A9P042_9AGAR|nr:hypothetical protein AMATHDRAFT_45148 [Amanita thiersii Skay4041]
MHPLLQDIDANDARRQPFSPVHNLPNSDKLQNAISFVPLFRSLKTEWSSKGTVDTSKPLPESRDDDVSQPQGSKSEVKDSLESVTKSPSIYSEEDSEYSQSVYSGEDAGSVYFDSTEEPPISTTEAGNERQPQTLKRVRTIYKLAGKALLERRGKEHEFDMSAGSMHHVSTLLKERRIAAERCFSQ